MDEGQKGGEGEVLGRGVELVRHPSGIYGVIICDDWGVLRVCVCGGSAGSGSGPIEWARAMPLHSPHYLE